MKRLCRVFLVITAGLLLASPGGAAFACGQCDPGHATAAAHAVTAKYHSLDIAQKAGYSILADKAGIACIAEQEMGAMGSMGAMGVHYVKGDLVKIPRLMPCVRKL
jgi:hypothetical protein